MTNTVLIKRSATANSVPLAGNLSLGELALNYTDGNLFYKNSSNVVTVIASNKFLSVTGNVTAGNLSGTSIVGTLTTAAQTNITSVGTLTSLAVTGNTTGGNILTGGIVSATGTVTGSQFNGSGAGLTSIPGANVTGTVPLATSATTAGTVTTAAQGNITSVGTLTSLNVTGNITGGNLSVTSIVGTLTTAAQNNITSIGTLGSLSVTGNITGGNILGGANVNATTHTGTTVSVSANITGGNLLTGGLISATANITGGNLSGTSIVGTLLTAAQTNITSVGTLSSLSVTGNIISSGSITSSSLTSGRVPYATTAGRLTDSSNMTFDGNTLALRSDTTTPTLSVLSNSATPNLRLGSAGNGSVYWQIGRDNVTTGDFIFSTEVSEKMRLTNAGNLGIGTTSPTGKLDISATTDGQLMAQVRNLSSGSSAYSAFFLGNDTNATAAYVGLNSSTNTARGGGANSFNIITGLNGPITFGVSGSEKVRIDSSGFVGIGQTTPISYLDIYGNGAYTYSRYWRSDQAGYGARFGTADTLYGSAPARSAGVDGFSAVVFGIAGTEKVRIDSSGNVGIGTSSPVDLLQINRASGSGITSGISLTTAAGSVGDGSYIKWTGATAGEKIARIDGVQEGTDTGSIRFNTGNGADGFTERMRIDSSGNVGIGTSSPTQTLMLGSGYIQTGQGVGGGGGVRFPYSSDAAGRTWRARSDITGYGDFGLEQSTTQTGDSYATQLLITQAGVLQFNSGYGSAAAAYGCRAWCQYNQSATIIGAGNVSSITIITTGDVRLNFATALVDANYSAVATTNESGGGPKWCNSTQPTTTTIRIVTFNADQSKGWFEYNSVAVFR